MAENRLTAEGRVLHDRAHEGGGESRPGLRVARGLWLRSLRLGISGQADVVEFHSVAEGFLSIHPERRCPIFRIGLPQRLAHKR